MLIWLIPIIAKISVIHLTFLKSHIEAYMVTNLQTHKTKNKTLLAVAKTR